MNRRIKGDGMIRKRKDGRWEGRIVIGHKNDGSPIYKSAIDKTQKGLLQKVKILKEKYDGVEIKEDHNITVREWTNRWLEEYALPTLRKSTIRGYRAMANKIFDYVGDKPLSRVTTAEIQRMYNHLRKNGRVHESPNSGKSLSAATVRSYHMFLHEIMEAAVNANLISDNPTSGTTIPKLERTEKKVLNAQQLDVFINAIENDPAWFDFFYLELTMGMRLGELSTLKWSDFNEREKTLHIQRTAMRTDEGVEVGETKTATGNRVVRLPESAYQLLIRRHSEISSEWIFPHFFKPNTHIDPASGYRQLKKILKMNNLPDIRFHDLRHTFATHALRNGVDPKTLSGILGHTNASFTLDTYTHITTDMRKNAAEIVGIFMTNILGDEIS